ncbi:hypothetical protein YQE_11076, partial [Dendroctonus ponderosae]
GGARPVPAPLPRPLRPSGGQAQGNQAVLQPVQQPGGPAALHAQGTGAAQLGGGQLPARHGDRQRPGGVPAAAARHRRRPQAEPAEAGAAGAGAARAARPPGGGAAAAARASARLRGRRQRAERAGAQLHRAAAAARI